MNGRLKRDGNGKTLAAQRISRSASSFILANKRASIASSSKSVQAPKPAVPVVAVAVPFQSTVQLPFPENGASVTSTSLLTLDRRVPQVCDREMCFGMRCGV